MRRFLKFLHTLGAAGFLGGMGALAAVVVLTPATMSGVGYATLIQAMAKITAWIIGPSMVLTVIAGLLSIAAHPPFQDAGWVWVKAATGILVLEGGLHVLQPIQDAAKRGAGALAGSADPADVGRLLSAEGGALWVLLAVSVVNIALGVWRPRFPNIPM